MTDIELTFHGAAQTVTGSCMEVAHGGRSILVDCGLFQGSRSLEHLNHQPFRFSPDKIDAVILTHAHIDHSGLLPRLAADGFSGPIWCTEATRDLLVYMLADAARIQESDAAHRNHRADRADEPEIAPLYTEADAERAIALIEPVSPGQWFEPAPGMRARLWNAGHILGAASIELNAGGVSVLFSGDLGPANKTFQSAPTAPVGIDHVICESTYGDRDRPDIEIAARQSMLEQEIKDALSRGGNLIIPVFAVERTQELLFDIATLINTGRLPNRPVFIDSPLASRATSVFAKHQRELADLGDGGIFDNNAFHYIETPAQSMNLNTMSGAVILAASGMCEGGRIRHHLIHNLARADSTVLFVGFQAQGTLGRTLLDGARRVRISGRDIAVRARVHRIESYSAHADRSDLLDWISARQPIRGSLFLSHGEPGAIAALRDACATKDNSVLMPAIGERYCLAANAPARRLSTGIPEIQQVAARDWQNDYADFAVNLKRQLQRIHDDAARRDAIRRMRHLLDDVADHRARKQAATRLPQQQQRNRRRSDTRR
ncbi:MBL fold metallo-hydrolase [Sphingomonas sp. KC8]|uniref:MBL fold metallo-hydrolase n=1 Tax=Sphingomonas sp. KC8 TaxID=1030157 RepID=UPI000681699E|nr:MBL fold metallo-hydrolase [Sphingomonas sp. KC8]ARS26251.1 MBL fold metallo-hydrolase [Sphingomonas sp. KC8]